MRVERSGPVTTVILNRPHARNAVNGPTAAALFAAFEQFDRDDTASVAVLCGEGGTFCAGADLKAFGTPEANAVHRTGPGRWADADGVVQAGDRRGQWLRGRRWSGAGAVVRFAGGRGRRGLRRVLPTLGCSADRRRHHPVAATHWAQPGDGHDPHRPRCQG
ncbi:enoyl-CoA hydratase, EchA5 [Mycobacterium xenopi 3993]|nr:enoyl-CoA hydratase, EchA5 [Mycobacterium xenopi 3993]